MKNKIGAIGSIIIWESMKVSLSQLVGISIWKNTEVFPDLGLN